MDIPAPAPLDAQPARFHQRIRLDEMCPPACARRHRARGFLGEPPFASAHLVELAEIVEQEVARRRIGEGRGGLGVQLRQQAEAEAFVRHRAQHLLDALQCRSRFATAGERVDGVELCEIEAHGKDGGEPADAAREIDAVGDVLAAMALEIDDQLARRHAVARLLPSRHRQRQGRQQHVVDVGAIGARRVAQQVLRRAGIERQRQALAVGDTVRRQRGVIARQRAGAGADGSPIGEIGECGRGIGLARQQLRPALEGRGAWRQPRRRASRVIVGGDDILDQDPPGDGIDREMMDREQEAAGALAVIEPHCPPQRAVDGVEARLQPRRRLFETRGPGGGTGRRTNRDGRAAARVRPRPAA